MTTENKSKQTPNKKKVSLVLGSGGAKGLAHIGVIHALETNGYEIHSISGCSIGALVGGIFAAGELAHFEQWVKAITPSKMVSLMDLAWQKAGILKGDRVIDTLREMIGDQAIESLPIKYTAVAADITSGKEVWLNQGSLFDAIRASVSLPLYLTPVKRNDIYLIDGGVLNPVPIAPTFTDQNDLIIAINLNGQSDPAVKQKFNSFKSKASTLTSVNQAKEDTSTFGLAIDKFIKKMRQSEAGENSEEPGAYQIATQAFEAMQSSIARQKLAAYPPDILVEIPRNICGTWDFDCAEQLIELGNQNMCAALGIKRYQDYKLRR